ncbi:MAG: serine/threonine-protein kinase [Planctomycetota bacterium]
MSELQSAEELAQLASDVGVLDDRQLQSAWSELGTRTASYQDFSQLLVRKGLLTNYQLDRMSRGLKTGYVYGKYKVLYLVGAGTFARVFRAADRDTGKVYALKVLRASQSASPKGADIFRREGELGASLRHPNIVPIHEVVSRGQQHYIVMEFIEGQNLRESFRVRGRLKWAEACSIATGILAGLQAAFQQGVTHRDLKMSNVLIASDGTAKLIDFGLAALDNATGDDGVDRTVEYAALEKATGVRKDDTRSDVFFAGYMLHQMLSGVSSLPTGRDRMKQLGRDVFSSIRPIAELAPDTPLPLTMVVAKALEMDPERRYQTPGDMLTDLKIAVRRAEAGGGDAAKNELASREGIGEDGQPRRLMVVESDTKRQDVLRELFKRNGYRVLVTSDPERAMTRFMTDAGAADFVLFCSASAGQQALEVFNRFGDEMVTGPLPSILLLDETHGALAPHAKVAEHRLVVQMPVKLRQLRESVLSAIHAAESR